MRQPAGSRAALTPGAEMRGCNHVEGLPDQRADDSPSRDRRRRRDCRDRNGSRTRRGRNESLRPPTAVTALIATNLAIAAIAVTAVIAANPRDRPRLPATATTAANSATATVAVTAAAAAATWPWSARRHVGTSPRRHDRRSRSPWSHLGEWQAPGGELSERAARSACGEAGWRAARLALWRGWLRCHRLARGEARGRRAVRFAAARPVAVPQASPVATACCRGCGCCPGSSSGNVSRAAILRGAAARHARLLRPAVVPSLRVVPNLRSRAQAVRSCAGCAVVPWRPGVRLALVPVPKGGASRVVSGPSSPYGCCARRRASGCWAGPVPRSAMRGRGVLAEWTSLPLWMGMVL